MDSLAWPPTSPGRRSDGRLPSNVEPLKLGASIPLSVQSAGVTWKGDTFHLVHLGSIKFDLDKSDRLTADIQAGVTEFDNVDYDISAAVFDGADRLGMHASVQSAADVGRSCRAICANHHVGLWDILRLHVRGRFCGQCQ